MTTNRDRVLALRQEGWRASDIARELGLNRVTVYDYIGDMRPLYLPATLHARILRRSRQVGMLPAEYLDWLTG